MRKSEPRITGVAMTTLIWKLESPYSSWNCGASGATRPQTEKHSANAKVASTRDLYAPGRGPVAALPALILRPPP